MTTKFDFQDFTNPKRSHFLKFCRFSNNTEAAIAYYNQGYRLELEGKLNEASVAYRRAIELDSNHSESYRLLGNILAKFGQLDEAIAYHQQASGLRGWSLCGARDYQFTDNWFSRHIPLWEEHLKSFAHKAAVHVLEIGSYQGMSTCWLLDNILTHPSTKITCVDPFYYPYQKEFDANVTKTGALSKVIKIASKSQDTLGFLEPNTYDFVHIDGTHDDDVVLQDAVLSWRLVKVGGLMIFDDYEDPNPEQNTQMGTDLFLSVFNSSIKLIHKAYQVIVMKTSNEVNFETEIPKIAKLYFKKGNQLQREGKLDAAIAAYRYYIKFNPNFSWSHHNLGEALAKKGRLDEAVIAYQRAIELNLNSAWSHYNLGEVFVKQGELDAAVTANRRALELNPNWAWLGNNLEEALVRQGQQDETKASDISTTDIDPDKRQEKNLSRRFCAKPFEFFELTANGDVFCCCPGWLPKPIGNLSTSDLMDIWNSHTAIDIRASILDGSFKYCLIKECPMIGNGTLPYKKDVSDPDLKEIIEKGLTVLKKKPKVLNLAYDRSCNLSCPSCRTEQIMINGKEYDEKRQLQDRLLAAGLDDAKELIVTGSGDPFASKLYRKLLATLDSDKYPNLIVHLITNGQLFTLQAWEQWHKIHSSIKMIQISIDAASVETYRIVRRGGDFQRLLVNLEFISSLKRKGAFYWVSLEFVVQKANYKEMKDFVELGKRFGFDKVSFAGIRNWGTFGKEEFRLQTVHDPNHPEYHQFLEVLKDPLFKDPIVNLGNLTDFLST
jgi:tetratricopeptide (TPR) repeat protein